MLSPACQFCIKGTGSCTSEKCTTTSYAKDKIVGALIATKTLQKKGRKKKKIRGQAQGPNAKTEVRAGSLLCSDRSHAHVDEGLPGPPAHTTQYLCALVTCVLFTGKPHARLQHRPQHNHAGAGDAPSLEVMLTGAGTRNVA